MKKKILFLFFFLLVLPISFSSLTYTNISENFPNDVRINYTQLLHCNSTNMQSNYEYSGSAGTWNVCRTYSNPAAYFKRNISDYYGGSTNQLKAFSTDAATTEERLDYIIFYKDYTEGTGFYLDNSTSSGWFGSSTGSAPTTNKVCWFFVNSSGFGGHVAHINNGCSYLESHVEALFGNNDVPNIDLNLDAYAGVNPNGTMKVWGTGSPGLIYGKYYDYIGFVLEDSQVNGITYLDQINLSGNTNGYGTNELPLFNLTPEKTYLCINNSQRFPQTINLNWSISDEENDIIYYGEAKGYTNGTEFIDFSNYAQVWPLEPFIYAEAKEFNKLESSCNINIDIDEYDNTKHNALLENDFFGYDSVMLQINGGCNETDKSVTVPFIDTAQALYFVTDIYNLDISEEFNLTLLDTTENSDFTLRFYRNSSAIYGELLLNNGSVDEMFSLTGNDYGFFRLEFTNTFGNVGNIKIEGTEYNNIGIIGIKEFTYEIDDITLDNLKYITYDVNTSSDIYVDSLSLAYVKHSLTWTTTQPQTISIEKPSYEHYIYFVSDDLHQPNSYTTQDFWIKAEQKEVCNEQSQGFEDFTDAIDIMLGNPLTNFLRYNGIYQEFITGLYILYFVLLVLFAVGFYKARGTLNLFLSSLLSSLSVFSLGFVVSSAGVMVSMLIIFTLSTIFFVRSNH